MAGGRGWLLRQFTRVSPWGGRTATTHTAHATVLPTTQGKRLTCLRLHWQVNECVIITCRFINNQTSVCGPDSSFSFLSLSPPVSELVPHPSTTEIISLYLQQSWVLPENFKPARCQDTHMEKPNLKGLWTSNANMKEKLTWAPVVKTYLLYMLWRFVKWMH